MHIPSLKEAQKRTSQKPMIQTDLYQITPSQKKIGQNKTYFLKTYGCQMNEHDSEILTAILEDMSFKKTENMEQADLILLNTCAIRENAHNKVFGYLGRIQHLKETKSSLLVGICGCMAQEETVVQKIKEKYHWIDFVFGTHNLYQIPSLLEENQRTNQTAIEVFSTEGDIIENLPMKRDSKYKAWINIMYGCDKFCTYCIVPYTRGKQRSRKPNFILEEIRKLKQAGYQEITLLGQNVNAYGKDLEEPISMAELLEKVADIGVPRIRFVTSHPWDFTDQMINVIQKRDNIMPYIHLPLQSGSNRILKWMGRRYTKEMYLELVDKLRKALPNMALTTDIIVGFPNETEADFQETLDVYQKCQFDSAFTFVFSKREGTPASRMKDSILEEEKNERLKRLNMLVNQIAREKNDAYLGKIVPVLIEGVSEKKDKLMGYTDTMKLVNVVGDISLIGKIVDVKITGTKTWSLDGKVETR